MHYLKGGKEVIWCDSGDDYEYDDYGGNNDVNDYDEDDEDEDEDEDGDDYDDDEDGDGNVDKVLAGTNFLQLRLSACQCTQTALVGQLDHSDDDVQMFFFINTWVFLANKCTNANVRKYLGLFWQICSLLL